VRNTSMILLPMKTEEHWSWMMNESGCQWTPTARGIVVLDHRMLPCAGVVFDGWFPNSGQIHFAMKNPLAARSGLFEEGFNYFYNECGKDLLIGVTPAHLDKALKFNKKVGLRETYRIKNGYTDGIDLVVQEMHRDECRWIKNGQEYSSAA